MGMVLTTFANVGIYFRCPEDVLVLFDIHIGSTNFSGGSCCRVFIFLHLSTEVVADYRLVDAVVLCGKIFYENRDEGQDFVFFLK